MIDLSAHAPELDVICSAVCATSPPPPRPPINPYARLSPPIPTIKRADAETFGNLHVTKRGFRPNALRTANIL